MQIQTRSNGDDAQKWGRRPISSTTWEGVRHHGRPGGAPDIDAAGPSTLRRLASLSPPAALLVERIFRTYGP